MQYGYFDDAAREYVITRPDTPQSWSNYLGSTHFGGIITNNAGGYGFFQSGARGRYLRLRFNSVPLDQPGRYFYLRDRQSGDCWSASWQPVGKPLDRYESICRHGLGYTVIASRYAGILAETTYFIPLGQTFEYWRLKLTNESGRPRELSLFSFCEFTNQWDTYQDSVNLQYSLFIVRGELTGDKLLRIAIQDHLTAENEGIYLHDIARHAWMGLAGAEISGYDTSREAFLGPYRGYHNPRTGERRDLVVARQSDLAAACGCSARTLRRELERNQALRLFVERMPARAFGRPARGGGRAVYRIAMEDPPMAPERRPDTPVRRPARPAEEDTMSTSRGQDARAEGTECPAIGSDLPNKDLPASNRHPDAPRAACDGPDAVVARLVDAGVTPGVAADLVARRGAEACRRQMAALPYRAARDPAAALVASIREEWAVPEAFARARRLEEIRRRLAEARRVEEDAAAAERASLEAAWAALSPAQQDRLTDEAWARVRSANRFLADRPRDSPAARAAVHAERLSLLREPAAGAGPPQAPPGSSLCSE